MGSMELLCTGKGEVKWNEYEDAELSSGQVRVESHYSVSKHGTEMALYKGYEMTRGAYNEDTQLFAGTPSPDYYPVPVGNMFVGRIIEKHPDVTELQTDDVVFGHGGFRSTHVIAASNCRKLPAGMSWKSAMCINPAEFALSAVRDANVRVGDRVAVFGLGAIGLTVVQLLELAGARSIIGVDPLPNRRDIAGQYGADHLLDPTDVDAGAEIRRLTGGLGADVCIEFSGSRSGLQHALRGVAFGGTVAAGAYPGPYDAGLDFGAEAHWNRPNLIFTRACSDPSRDHPRWDDRRIIDTCYDLLTEGKLSGDSIVNPVVRFDELLEEYPNIARDPNNYIKLAAEHQT